MNWQDKNTEPMLFHEAVEPQYLQSCCMPSTAPMDCSECQQEGEKVLGRIISVLSNQLTALATRDTVDAKAVDRLVVLVFPQSPINNLKLITLFVGLG